MKDSVILEGKIYISAKRAAKIINYAQDYIGQLCRSGKLDCKMIGRSWFVTEESLLAHRESAIDATQERVLKVIKNNDVAIKETIKASIEDKKADCSGYRFVCQCHYLQ
jgi:Holliday junction resolvase